MFFKSTTLPPSAEQWTGAAAVALIVLAAATLLNLLERVIVAWKVPATSDLQCDLQHEIATLKRQAQALNHPETFSQCAKLERKALAYEKQLARLQGAQEGAKNTRMLKIPIALRTIGLLGLFAASFRVPVAVAVQSEWVWPAGRWLAMGTGRPAVLGLVGIIPWGLLCHRVSRAIMGPTPR